MNRWLWNHNVCENLSARCESLRWSSRPMTMPLYFYGPNLYHRTYDGPNLSSGCRFTASARIWVPNRIFHKVPRANDHVLHIYGPRRFYRAWNGDNRSNGYSVTASARIWVPGRDSRQLTMPMHIYRPRWFHRIRNGTERSSCFGGTASA